MRKWCPHFGHTFRFRSRSFLKIACAHPGHFVHRPSVRTVFSPSFWIPPSSSRLNQLIGCLPCPPLSIVAGSRVAAPRVQFPSHLRSGWSSRHKGCHPERRRMRQQAPQSKDLRNVSPHPCSLNPTHLDLAIPVSSLAPHKKYPSASPPHPS